MSKLIQQMVKEKNLPFWSSDDLEKYINKPVKFDANYYPIFDSGFEYSEEEKDAIEAVSAMEIGTMRG